MSIAPSSHHFNVFTANARIEHEEHGVYRITKPSLTGKGTHTKWFYPEQPVPWSGKETAAALNSSGAYINGTSSALSAGDTIPEITMMEDDENGGVDPDVHWDSDATELIDEETEAEQARQLRRLPRLRDEEPLPDLPFDLIMRRIAQEPTLPLDDPI